MNEIEKQLLAYFFNLTKTMSNAASYTVAEFSEGYEYVFSPQILGDEDLCIHQIDDSFNIRENNAQRLRRRTHKINDIVNFYVNNIVRCIDNTICRNDGNYYDQWSEKCLHGFPHIGYYEPNDLIIELGEGIFIDISFIRASSAMYEKISYEIIKILFPMIQNELRNNCTKVCNFIIINEIPFVQILL